MGILEISSGNKEEMQKNSAMVLSFGVKSFTKYFETDLGNQEIEVFMAAPIETMSATPFIFFSRFSINNYGFLKHIKKTLSRPGVKITPYCRQKLTNNQF